MSAVAPPSSIQTSSAAPKKKTNKKKKGAKGKINGDLVKTQDLENNNGQEVNDGEGDEEDTEPSAMNTPHDGSFPDAVKALSNGHKDETTSNGSVTASSARSSMGKQTGASSVNGVEDKTDGTISNAADASHLLEVMSKEREELKAEVEQLRKALEGIQGKHDEEISTIRRTHVEDISNIQGKHAKEVSEMKELLLEELSTVRGELTECETARDHAETQYQSLLGRVNSIKASLGERLKADKEELLEAKDQIQELESHNEELQKHAQSLESEVSKLEQELADSSKELSSFRNRHNLSQQNWVKEREDFLQQTRQLKEEAEAAKEAMGDWEVLAMEERSIREGLAERIVEMEEQFSSQKEAYEAAVLERDSQAQIIDGLQRALQEIQETRKKELREAVESYEDQLQALRKIVHESDNRANEAEASKAALRKELDRLTPFEKEVKEKNLLIGKLRHEAIVLNDHLIKALRVLKKSKPEDNVDRQIVTNHFLHFLTLDRSDPRKFQILQLIAALLGWTDEQKEQAGLARPGASTSNSLRLPLSPFHRTPSSPSLSTEFFIDSPSNNKESLAELWTEFLERNADEGSTAGSRSGSVSSSAPRIEIMNPSKKPLPDTPEDN
ncbi:hypothetical protein B7463_g8539, partial [Scytalidium lignicola]